MLIVSGFHAAFVYVEKKIYITFARDIDSMNIKDLFHSGHQFTID